MPRRSRLNRSEIGETVIWSASEHLIVERPIAPPRRQLHRRIASLGILLGCMAVIAYLLAKPPASVLQPSGPAPTPTAWFHRYAFNSRQQLRLVSLTEHGTVAVLQITDSGRIHAVSLRERDGEWHAVSRGDG